MIKGLIKLYEEQRMLTLLEIAYFALAVITFMVAGTLALFNQSLGVSMLIMPLSVLVVGVANIVVWSLVKLLIESLASKNASKTASKTTAKTSKK